MTTQLPEVLIRNSYNILGLSSTSTLKEIRKRSQQLLQLAKIEEVQEFEIDIGNVKTFRDETTIRTALERISGVQDRLKEFFFWFEAYSTESQKAISLIAKKDYNGALGIFENTENSSIDWLGKKNSALALMFQAFARSDLANFYQSLSLWKLIAKSDDFWQFYEKHYLLHDELDTTPSLFEEFKYAICEILSTKTVAFYHQTKYPKVIGASYDALEHVGKVMDVEVLQPLILKAKKELEELEKIDPASPPEAALIERRLKNLHKCFQELDRFELSSFSPLIVLKNDTAEKLRSISVDLYNQNTNHELALMFLDQGSKLAISEVVANKIKADEKQINDNKAWQSVSDKCLPIQSLIECQKIKEAKNAYLLLDSELAGPKGRSPIDLRSKALIIYCTVLTQKGHDLFNKLKFGIETLAISGLLNRKTQKDAILAFNHIWEILKNRLYLFDFIDPEADKAAVIKLIDTISHDLKNCEVASLFGKHKYYLQLVEDVSDRLVIEQTRIAIKILGAAICHAILYDRIYCVTQKKMWKMLGWCASIVFIFFVNINKENSNQKSTHQSNYQSKTSYSYPTQSLTYDEKKVIEYLQKNHQTYLKDARNDGYSDKEIAQYVIKLSEEKKNNAK